MRVETLRALFTIRNKSIRLFGLGRFGHRTLRSRDTKITLMRHTRQLLPAEDQRYFEQAQTVFSPISLSAPLNSLGRKIRSCDYVLFLQVHPTFEKKLTAALNTRNKEQNVLYSRSNKHARWSVQKTLTNTISIVLHVLYAQTLLIT